MHAPFDENPTSFASTLALSLDTVPMGLDTLPMALDACAQASQGRAVKLLVQGLSDGERQLIESVVRLSQPRTPRLQLIDGARSANADVIIVDALDARAMQWTAGQQDLADKAVLWVDALSGPCGHVLARRPVPWPLLPLMLARALEHHADVRQAGPSQRQAAAADVTMSGSVLLVESCARARAELVHLMNSRGASAVESADVAQAVKAIARQTFSWVLVGLQSEVSGERRDGFEICRQLTQAAPTVPVLMLGRQVSPFDRLRAQMAGAAALLMLPQDAQQLFNAIDRAAAQGVVPAAADPTAPLQGAPQDGVRR